MMTRWMLSIIVACVAMAICCSASEPVVFPDVGQSLSLDAGDVMLNASLLLPAGNGPFPAVVGLVGSGGYTYRDAWIEGHWPFWKELSDVLTERRIAVLLLDKRGVAGSEGSWKKRTLQERAADALVAVRYLRQRDDIDGARVGVTGQSQGGWVAQIAAASAPQDVAFVITFAGPATTVLEQVVDDRESELRCEGLSPDAIAKKRAKYEALALLRSAFEASGNSRLFTHTLPGVNHAFLYGEPCEPLKGHDGRPSFEAALLNPGFFDAIGISIDE